MTKLTRSGCTSHRQGVMSEAELHDRTFVGMVSQETLHFL